MGYGLAIYVDRHFGTLLFALPNLGRLRQAKLAAQASPTKVESAVPVANTGKPRPRQIAAVVASPASNGATLKDATAGATEEDVENIRVGNEEFRSQVAKAKTSELNAGSAVAGVAG